MTRVRVASLVSLAVLVLVTTAADCSGDTTAARDAITKCAAERLDNDASFDADPTTPAGVAARDRRYAQELQNCARALYP